MKYPVQVGDVFVFSDTEATEIDSMYVDEDDIVQLRLREGTYGADYDIIAPSDVSVTYDDLVERVRAQGVEQYVPRHERNSD